MHLPTKSDSSAFSLQYKADYVVTYDTKHNIWKNPTRLDLETCLEWRLGWNVYNRGQQTVIVHLYSCPVFWQSVAWCAAIKQGYIWTITLNSNQYSLVTCWLNVCCKLCLKTMIIILLSWTEVGNVVNYEILKKGVGKYVKTFQLYWSMFATGHSMGFLFFFFTHFINFICTNCAAHVPVKGLQKMPCLLGSKYFVIDWD